MKNSKSLQNSKRLTAKRDEYRGNFKKGSELHFSPLNEVQSLLLHDKVFIR
jgi:hypothetical protein